MSARRPLWPAAVPVPPAARTRAATTVLLPVLVTVLLTLLGLTAGGAAATTTPSPSPAPSDVVEGDVVQDDGDAPAVEVLVTELTPQVLRPSDELVVRATIRNAGDETLSDPAVRLRVNRFLQSTRSSLEQWVEQELDETAGVPVLPPLPLDGPLLPGDSTDVELRVAATALGLSASETAWGPRGLSVEVTDGGTREGILRTFLLWLPAEQAVAPTRVSVLVPLTGGPVDPITDPTADDVASAGPGPGATPGRNGGPDTPDDADEPSGAGAPPADVLRRLDDVLDATAAQPAVSWAVDPALVVAARSPGAGAAANRWAQALTAAAPGRDVFTLPSRDPDLAALAHGGGEALGALATAAAAASGPSLGSPVRTDLAWPATGVPDVPTVALAARLGARAVVVGAGGLVPDELTYTPTGRATVPTAAGPVAALVADEALTEQLAAPAGGTAAAAAQRMLAETAVVTRERPNEPRHLLVTADRDWAPEAPVAAAQVAALASAPWVDLTPLSTLIGAGDPDVDRSALPDRRVDEDEVGPQAIGALVRAHAELAAFSSVVPDPARLLRGADDAVVAPTGVAWRAEPDERAGVVDAVVARLTARRSGVSIVPGSSLVLLSETGRFPLGLRNDLDQDATVQVAVEPASARLVVDGTEQVVVPARSESQARIPFHAVGSGDVVVQVSLLTPEGVPLGAPEQFTVRVRADWENVGTAVVAGLLGVALVVGIIRTIRRGQTARRGAGSIPVTAIAALPRDEP